MKMFGKSPLHVAIADGQVNVLKTLLQYTSNVDVVSTVLRNQTSVIIHKNYSFWCISCRRTLMVIHRYIPVHTSKHSWEYLLRWKQIYCTSAVTPAKTEF